MNLSPEEAAYIAGFIDGEGYIGIKKRIHADTNYVEYQVVVSVTNTNLEILLWFKALFGGWIWHRKSVNDPSNWKRRHMWGIASKSASNLIESIYPFLKLKKSQATLALEFQKTIGRKQVSIRLYEQREFIRLQIKSLNKTGTQAVSEITA